MFLSHLFRAGCAAALMLLLPGCGSDDKPEAPLPKIESLTFEQTSYEVGSGAVKRLNLLIKPEGGAESVYNNQLNPYDMTWGIDDPSVASITQGGMLTALKRGSATVTVATPYYTAPVSATIVVDGGVSPEENLLTEQLARPLSAAIIYSRNVRLARNSVLQSFDIDSGGDIFYIQIAGTDAHSLNVLRGAPAPGAEKTQLAAPLMTLTYFGHGTNMAVEEEGDDRWIWAGSYGSKESGSDGYSFSQTIARVKFVPGTDCKPEQCTEHYFLPGVRHIHPALDPANDVLGVTYSGGGTRHFAFYRLSDAKALAPTTEQLEQRTWGGGATDPNKTPVTESPAVQVRNLGRLTRLGGFSLTEGSNPDQIGKYAFQGFDVKNGRVFYYEGENNLGNTFLPSNAYLTVFDFQGGIRCARTRVGLLDDRKALQSNSISQVGSLEAEGVKWHDGKLYLRVVDYKTGRKAFSLSDVWYGMGLQMLLYLFALERSGPARYGHEIVPAGVLYVPARDVLIPADRRLSPEEAARERAGAVRRSGLLLDDAAVLHAMEHSDTPQYLPVSPRRKTDALASAEQLGLLARHIETTLLDLAHELRGGSITADPYFRSGQDTACTHCDYLTVCHFTPGMGGDCHRVLTKLPADKVWSNLKGGAPDA